MSIRLGLNRAVAVGSLQARTQVDGVGPAVLGDATIGDRWNLGGQAGMQDTVVVGVEQRGEDGLLHHHRKRFRARVRDEAVRLLEEPVDHGAASLWGLWSAGWLGRVADG